MTLGTLTKLLLEGDLGCLLIRLAMNDAAKIRAWAEANILPKNLAPKGFEPEVHVTVLYGFTADVTADQVQKVISACHMGHVDIRLGLISRFKNEEYDVLQVAVESPNLQELNQHLRSSFGSRVKSTYSYIPHLTLAYVKPGTHKELDKHAEFDGQVYRLKDLIFSLPNSKRKIPIVLAEVRGARKLAAMLDEANFWLGSSF